MSDEASHCDWRLAVNRWMGIIEWDESVGSKSCGGRSWRCCCPSAWLKPMSWPAAAHNDPSLRDTSSSTPLKNTRPKHSCVLDSNLGLRNTSDVSYGRRCRCRIWQRTETLANVSGEHIKPRQRGRFTWGNYVFRSSEHVSGHKCVAMWFLGCSGCMCSDWL